MEKQFQLRRPVSAVPHAAALASLCGALVVLATFKWSGSQDAAFCLVAVAVFIALPHVGLVLVSWEKLSLHGLRRPQQWQRLGIKLLGQLGLFGALALAYFVFQGFAENYLRPLTDLGGELALLVPNRAPISAWLTQKTGFTKSDCCCSADFAQLIMCWFANIY